MKDQPSAEQIASYQKNGFLAIDGFLDAAELEHWRATTDEAVEQRLRERSNSPDVQKGTDDYYAKVFTQCLKLADSHAGMRKIMLDERLGHVTASLAGVDGIRIWHDQALIKQPYGNPTGWHLDNPYWSFTSRDSISIWMALDDATLINGCMHYLPGTQKTAREDNPGIGPDIGAMFKVYPEWLKVDPVAVPVKAGTAVFHNGLTAHGAGANMTNRPRRAMTCAYMPDGSTFNGKRNILPEAYFKTLKPGDLLNDNTVNPLIYKK